MKNKIDYKQKYEELKTFIEVEFTKKKFVGESKDRTFLVERYYEIVDGKGGEK